MKSLGIDIVGIGRRHGRQQWTSALDVRIGRRSSALDVRIGRRPSALSKSITTIALTLTLLAIPYIYVYKNAVKLETSLRHSPSSQVVWYTHQNNHLSSTKSTVQSVYNEYHRLDLLQENLVRGPHKCGWRKCLFPLKTDPRIGYLVERGDDAEARSNAFAVSKNIIEEKYGMNHIYLAPPKIMSFSRDFRKWMEMDMTSHPSGGYLPEFRKQPEVTVQAVAIVPEEDSIMLGLKGPRRQNGLKGIEEMFTPRSNESWNITDVERAVKHDFESLYRLVEDEKDDKLPCLCADFQIFLLRSGHLIHLDVERCFEMPDLMERRCVPELQELETLVLNRLQKSRLEQEQQRMGVVSNSSLPPTLSNASMVAPLQAFQIEALRNHSTSVNGVLRIGEPDDDDDDDEEYNDDEEEEYNDDEYDDDDDEE